VSQGVAAAHYVYIAAQTRHDSVFGLDGLHVVHEHCCKILMCRNKERELGESNWVSSWLLGLGGVLAEPELVDRKGMLWGERAQ
jgi:hypothetical protein